MSEQTPGTAGVPTASEAPPPAGASDSTSTSGLRRLMSGSVGRNLGLVVALLLLVIVGAVTAPDTFLSVSNTLTILRQASILGVVAILVAAINISGGFLVTQRMLAMFRRDEPPR